MTIDPAKLLCAGSKVSARGGSAFGGNYPLSFHMKILFFGDIVGKVGRRGVAKILPTWKETYQPDVVIANAENLAHGAGITKSTIDEMVAAGVDFFTSGNHIWDKQVGDELLDAINPLVIRPLNFSRKSGVGMRELDIDGKKLLVVNIQAQVFMRDEVENPFHAMDSFLAKHPPKNYDAIFVDFHGEATSEKVSMGWHLDGRASVLVGTHTHIPTADARILPDGTAYITDVGMNGLRDSVIGVTKESVLKRFVKGEKSRFEYPDEGACDINAVLVEIGEKRKAVSIELLQTTVEV